MNREVEIYQKALIAKDYSLLDNLKAYATKAEIGNLITSNEKKWQNELREIGTCLIKFLQSLDTLDKEKIKAIEKLAVSCGGLHAKKLWGKDISTLISQRFTKFIRQVFLDMIYEINVDDDERKKLLYDTRYYFCKFEQGVHLLNLTQENDILKPEEGALSNEIDFYSEDKIKTHTLNDKTQCSLQFQNVLNNLLNLALENLSLEQMLKLFIDELTLTPWLGIKTKGAIFLVEGNSKNLVLKAQRGLDPSLQVKCSRVPFGKCLCGRAALTGKIVFVDRVDEQHETQYEGIQPHGHYCVPIFSNVNGNLIGVFTIYLKEGYRLSKTEEDFILHAIANVLAGIIRLKQTEENLRLERDRAAKYLNLANVIFVALDKTQKVILINNKGCDVLGYHEQEIIGCNWFDKFLPPNELYTVKKVFEKLIAGESELAEYHENHILTKNGQERLIAWHNTILRDEKGNISEILSSGEDITERKRS